MRTRVVFRFVAMPKLEPDGQLIVLETVLESQDTHSLLDTAWAAVNGSNEAGLFFYYKLTKNGPGFTLGMEVFTKELANN